MTLKRMTQWSWKMLAMPSAKHRIMQRTPVLYCDASDYHSSPLRLVDLNAAYH